MEIMRLTEFLKKNLSDPDKLIEAYKEEPEKWKSLMASFPVYRQYLGKYPELVAKLREGGVPV